MIDSHQKILASEGRDYIHVLDNLAESSMRGREESSGCYVNHVENDKDPNDGTGGEGIEKGS